MAAARPQAGALTAAYSTLSPQLVGTRKEKAVDWQPIRFHSSRADTVQKSPGSVTKTLRVLDMDVVRSILEELKSVDVNSDGR